MRLPAGFILFAAIAAAIAASARAATPPDATDPLYDAAKQLFDQYAPPEVKEQYEFPTPDRIDEFAARLQRALDGGSLGDLAQYQTEARAALAVLRTVPGDIAYADWLAARLEEIEAARRIIRGEPAAAAPSVPARGALEIPYYEVWLERVRRRPVPEHAAVLMPRLRAAFVAEGVPPELAWLAEAESSFNPEARNPSGACGLFQLKPGTARDLGLSIFMPDERTDPDKSAHAAARQLRTLGRHFGSWPLAIAAYNAGEGRVGRALAAHSSAHNFAGIAASLPAGTRMYVPEVCALVTARSGITPDQLPAPR